MSSWTKDELERIAITDDLHISHFREDRTTYGTPAWIWSVVVDGDLYVRAYNGRNSRWYQAAMQQKAGRITAAGVTLLLLVPVFAWSQGRDAPKERKSKPMQVSEDVRMAAPGLDKYAQGPIADLWKRPGLTARDRNLITVAALIARNQTNEIPRYVNLAIDSGVKPREISEIITHLAFYSGWANAISAATVARRVFAERKIGADQLPAASPPLLPLDRAAEDKRAAGVEQQFGKVAPGVVQYTTDVLFRDLWLRPDLAPRDRSLVTVAALIANGQAAQISYHLNRAMDNGLTQEQAAEAITHLAFYAGWPNVFSALPVAKDVFEQRPQ